MELALNISKEELKDLIKDAVREVIEESSWERFMKDLEYVSPKEMKEIESNHSTPDEDVYYSEEVEI
jgi:hypothetical protein